MPPAKPLSKLERVPLREAWKHEAGDFMPWLAEAANLDVLAQALGLSHRDIVSGAGHDAVYVARTAPTAMIFVPCKDGISHNEIEDARPEHLEAGANVLLHAMLARAGVV